MSGRGFASAHVRDLGAAPALDGRLEHRLRHARARAAGRGRLFVLRDPRAVEAEALDNDTMLDSLRLRRAIEFRLK